uniref:Uncharacterized protein n=1 Tax=Rhizophora mucronata TaxID=61149 RepID=A0A2P2QRS5_RHIMU
MQGSQNTNSVLNKMCDTPTYRLSNCLDDKKSFSFLI